MNDLESEDDIMSMPLSPFYDDIVRQKEVTFQFIKMRLILCKT